MSGIGDMNGLWSGWYGYGGLAEPVPFPAWFDETSGLLTGSILEPNTISTLGIEDLTSDIAGTRVGGDITFVKTYVEGQGVHSHPISYTGLADGDFQRVRGEWMFPDPNYGRGPFELARSSRGISEGILREVLAPVGGGERR